MSNGPEVIIASDFFTGSIGAARNSADTVQYIGCLVYGTASGKSVYCSARNANGNVAACTSNVAQLIEAVAAMNENSILDIGYGGGVCSHIYVQGSSFALPVSP